MRSKQVLCRIFLFAESSEMTFMGKEWHKRNYEKRKFSLLSRKGQKGLSEVREGRKRRKKKRSDPKGLSLLQKWGKTTPWRSRQVLKTPRKFQSGGRRKNNRVCLGNDLKCCLELPVRELEGDKTYFFLTTKASQNILKRVIRRRDNKKTQCRVFSLCTESFSLKMRKWDVLFMYSL